MATELTAQQRANRRQDQKRAGQPKYLLRMDEGEAALLDKLAKQLGSKKAALMAGLKLLSSKS